MELPKMNPRPYLITTYGAIGDGASLNTKAIQDAIDEASRNGGGTVVVPPGTFLTGSVILKSGVRLHLQLGATLLGSVSYADYVKLSRWPALILAEGQTDIAIVGQGTIDGQGQELALAMKELYFVGEIPENYYNHRRSRISEEERPQVIEFVGCERLLISGVTIKNSASWVQTYSLCADLTIEGITVDSDCYWNNDGIDIDDSKNVLIRDCDVNSADDGICLKSDLEDAGCANIVIEHCRVRSSASAIKFGTASKSGFRDVIVRDISVYDTYRSAIALESVDGGILENIDVSEIYAHNVGNALFIRLGHRNVQGAVGRARGIRIRKFRIEVPFGRPDLDYGLRGPGVPFLHNPIPASIVGIPGHDIQDVLLEDIEITYPGGSNKGMACVPVTGLSRIPENEAAYPEFSMFEELPAWALYVRHVDGLTLRGIRLRLKKFDFRPAFVFDEVKNLAVGDVRLFRAPSRPQIVLREVHGATIRTNDGAMAQEIEGCQNIAIVDEID